MKWLISYDVLNDANRSRIARRLEQIGFRRQYSVFELELSIKQLDELFQELTERINPATDRLTAWSHSSSSSIIRHTGLPREKTERDWQIL